jgi:hypothetical protein
MIALFLTLKQSKTFNLKRNYILTVKAFLKLITLCGSKRDERYDSTGLLSDK